MNFLPDGLDGECSGLTAGESFFFRRKKKQESLVWLVVLMIPAACRRGILLSLEDVRQFAGGVFFFRRKMSGSLPEGYSSFVAERRTKKGATLSNGWTGRRKIKAPLKIAFSAM